LIIDIFHIQLEGKRMKRMLKRIVILITLLTITVMLFVGCGAQKQEAQQEAQKEGDLLAQIKAKGVVTVGLMGTYPPYNFMNEQNEVDGFDADIAKEIAKRLGVEVKFIPTEWSAMIAGLEKGKFDMVISQMTITEERKKQMDFSEPYIKNTVNIIVRADNTTIDSLEDFKGKRIGVGLGTNDETYLREVVMPKVGEFEIVTYNDVITTLMDLDKGRIDATINNLFAIKPQVEKNNLKVKAVGEPVKEDFAGVAIRKGNPELVNAVEQALQEMIEDGTYKDIHVKWFGVEPNF